MRKGKLTPAELQNLIFNTIKSRREEVLLHAGIGEDCAAIKADGDYILVTTDPITAQCDNPGSLAIYINANDIAAAGAEPVAVTLTILAPTSCSTAEIGELMKDAERAAAELNIEIIGGHTEFTDAVNRIVVSCTMLGRSPSLIGGKGPEDGDSIIMTKYAAIEGTVILAERYASQYKEYAGTLKELQNSLSVMKEGRIAAGMDISSMHDITEGGVFGAVAEMCALNGCGAVIDADAVPMTELTRKLCGKLNLDPYKLLSSGSMLITAKEPLPIIEALKAANISAAVVGKINSKGEVKALVKGKLIDVAVEADEILGLSGD